MIAWAFAGHGMQNGYFPPSKLGLRTKYFSKHLKSASSIPINWFDSCNDSFFDGMKLTLHKSQVHSYSVMQWWACNSLSLFLCLQRRVVKVASGLFCTWSLLRNNTVATNPQRFTLYYGSRWFVARDCCTQTSWQVMQRDSGMLIAVSHVHLYFVKRSMSKSIAMLPQVWKIQY